VSGNSPTLVPTAADGSPLANAITWIDRRSTEEARWIGEMRGCPTDASHFLPKALWLLRNRPRIYEGSRWFFSCPEYVVFKLTGVAATFLPTSQYARSIMWDAEAVRSVGKVTAACAGETGVPEGVPVFAGAPDYIVSLLGTAAVAPGRACLRSGTSEGVNLCSRTEVRDPRLMCVNHIAEGCFNVSGFSSCPLTGERAPIWDPDARGAFIGLTLNHRASDMTRAQRSVVPDQGGRNGQAHFRAGGCGFGSRRRRVPRPLRAGRVRVDRGSLGCDREDWRSLRA
jgi:sugar (pentulose or hexulose) kinase